MITVASRKVLGKAVPQLAFKFKTRRKRKVPTHGGKRAGAGRPLKDSSRKRPPGKKYVPHDTRAEVNRRHPQHVTLTVLGDISHLRSMDMYAAVKRSLRVAANHDDFRIVHFSVQGNHIHLLVEADNKDALTRGVQGFEISLAKRINPASSVAGARVRSSPTAITFARSAASAARATRSATS